MAVIRQDTQRALLPKGEYFIKFNRPIKDKYNFSAQWLNNNRAALLNEIKTDEQKRLMSFMLLSYLR